MRLLFLPPVFFLILGVLALATATTNFAATHLWSLRPTADLFAVYWLLALATAVPIFLRRGQHDAFGDGPSASPSRWTALLDRRFTPGIGASILIQCVLVAVGLLLLWIFRQRLFLAPPNGLGDSLLILEQVPVYAHLLGYLDSFDELLELYWRCKLYLFTNGAFGWHVEVAYALISTGAFAMYGAALFWFLRGRSLFEIFYGTAVLLCAPALQLYAGYVEHYSVASALLACTIMIGAGTLEKFGDGNLKHPVAAVIALAAAAALATLHHAIVAVTIPALIYLVWRLAGGEIRGIVRLGAAAAFVAMPILFGVWIWFLFFEQPPLEFFDSHAASPPFYRPSELFRPEQLRNRINLLFLASPAAALILGTIVALSLRAGGDASAANAGELTLTKKLKRLAVFFVPEPVHVYLLMTTLTLAATLFVMEPRLGFPGDWDLHTIYQFPLNLFLFYLIRTQARATTGARRILSLLLPGVLLVNGFVTAGWIGRNAQASEISRTNLESAHANVQGFLQTIPADPVYARVSAARMKTYIQVKLFFIRSRTRVQSGAGTFSATERADLLRDLSQGEAQFNEWILLPQVEFDARYDRLWNAWSQLNVRINTGDPG